MTRSWKPTNEYFCVVLVVTVSSSSSSSSSSCICFFIYCFRFCFCCCCCCFCCCCCCCCYCCCCSCSCSRSWLCFNCWYFSCNCRCFSSLFFFSQYFASASSSSRFSQNMYSFYSLLWIISGILRSCYLNLRIPNHLLYFDCMFFLILLKLTFAAIVTGDFLFFFFLSDGSWTILVLSLCELK